MCVCGGGGGGGGGGEKEKSKQKLVSLDNPHTFPHLLPPLLHSSQLCRTPLHCSLVTHTHIPGLHLLAEGLEDFRDTLIQCNETIIIKDLTKFIEDLIACTAGWLL